jgi:hypothetical protein
MSAPVGLLSCRQPDFNVLASLARIKMSKQQMLAFAVNWIGSLCR